MGTKGGSECECECLEADREKNERQFFLAKATKRSGGDGVGRGNRQANFSSVQDFATHKLWGWGPMGEKDSKAFERVSEGRYGMHPKKHWITTDKAYLEPQTNNTESGGGQGQGRASPS